MPWADSLNCDQRRAASHTATHGCMLAGPGTGKTHTLAWTVLYLIEEEGVAPEDILLVTFTRKAAGELRARIEDHLPERLSVPRVSTLHSFALSTILRHEESSALPQPIRVADDYEERRIIQEDLKTLLQMNRVADVQVLMRQLSADWERLEADRDDWEAAFPNPRFIGAWQEHREIYGYTLRAEMVYRLKHMLEEGALDPQVIAPQHLLVDEYQDLNPCELAVIRELGDAGAKLHAAGDDDQSIYGFRYANPEGIRRFTSHYSPSDMLPLRECMRCDRRILDYGLYVAEQDPRRAPKELRCSEDAEEGEIHLLHFLNQYQEADGVAKICRCLITKQGVQPENILILMRSDRHNTFSEPIRHALEGENILVAVATDPLAPLKDPDRIAGRLFFCLLRLLIDRRDHLAWRTLLEWRTNDVGPVTINAVYDLARTCGTGFSDVVYSVRSDPSIIPRGRQLKEDVELVLALLEEVTEQSTADLSSFIGQFATNHICDEVLRFEVIQLFERVIANSEISDLEELLRSISVSLAAFEQETAEGNVAVMTMHQAKGLSADAVILVGAEDEYIPGRGDLDDERRLLYVSLTRARHYLYVTHCQRRTRQQRRTGRPPYNVHRHLTRFLSGGPVPSQDGPIYTGSLSDA